MPDDRIPVIVPPAYVVLVQAALGERYRVTASGPQTVALAGYSDSRDPQNGVLWSCGHDHMTRAEAVACKRRQAGALC